ncbi:glycoside hydrolase family 61 protein [Annulohypoxylon maeteangense]|uniref:glycoside hydrolase family 61 protein n=1 Tax=Annulohypoxylon maeteangense TaxID=1927788 RepID=UPI002007FD71|nr:glycoside hydrolase family 61 protein [Annulohypoxylon maeteangense]KAI0889069.1 glycoside hydrolase family 61 protein [Annulohypoxylon maeteangense]
MKHSSLFKVMVATFIVTAEAHTTFTTLFVNDVSQGDGTCVRMSMNPQTCSYPVASIDSDDMACGASGNQPVAFTCPTPTGAKLSFEWREWADAEQPGALDISHKGPCAVYAKQVHNMTTDSAAGPGWIKLWDEGYDDSSGKWCTEKLIDNNGMMSIDLPEFLSNGYWLIRPELLALHQADKGDPQFYTGCAQVYIQNSDTATLNVPAEYSVSIPGYVQSTDPGLTFNIYSPKFPYPMPGPKVYQPTKCTSKAVLTSASSRALKQSKGVIPSNYLIKNANWVGVEVPDYSTEDGCWKSSEACFSQAKECYDSAPPTGSANCHVWEDKCDGISAACNAGNFNGPPNKGQKLQSKTPTPPFKIPEAVNSRRSMKLRVRRAKALAMKLF